MSKRDPISAWPTIEQSWRSQIYRFGMNLWPGMRGTGARLTHVAADFRDVRLRLPLKLRTLNMFGSIFGGSMYAAIDPHYAIMLLVNLGPGYIVWDKAATIRFRRPARETLYVRFHLTAEQIAHARQQATPSGELTLPVYHITADGTVCAETEKVIYVRHSSDTSSQDTLQARIVKWLSGGTHD